MSGVPGGPAFHGLTTARLDAVDREIVRLLQGDGRTPISELARRVGLSHASTSQRVQRLFAAHILAIGAITDPTTHGYSRRATMLIRTGADPRTVANRIAELSEVYYVVLVTGRLDVLIEFMARDDSHFEELSRQIRGVEGVIDTEAVPFLDLIKWQYSPDFVGIGYADGSGDSAEPTRS